MGRAEIFELFVPDTQKEKPRRLAKKTHLSTAVHKGGKVTEIFIKHSVASVRPLFPLW